MASQHSSAGVYTKSNDLSGYGARTKTTVVGTVGQARQGPVNKRVNPKDDADFTDIFGKRDPKYGMMMYCADSISANTANAHYVRLVNNAKYAVCFLTVDDMRAKVQKLSLAKNTVNGVVTGVLEPSDVGFLPTDPGIDNIIGAFICENPGEWNNSVSIKVSSSCPKGLDPVAHRSKYNTKIFQIEVFLGYAGTYSAAAETHLVTLDEYKDEFDVQYLIEDKLKNSKYIRFVRNDYMVGSVSFVSSAFTFMGGGDDGDRITEDQIAEAYIEHFSDPEELAVNLLVDTDLSGHIVQRAMQSVADKHINCHVIGNVPSDQQSVNAAVRYRRNTLNLRSQNMSLYTCDIQMFDAHTGRKLWVPCTGYVAGVYCYVDNTRGSYFAPAGIKASANMRILDMRYFYDQDDRDALTDAQINYFRKLPNNLGTALWEQATLLDTPSAFQMVAIQRLTGFVLASAAKTCKIGLFDPNDDILRSYLKEMVEDILRAIRRNRGLRTRNSDGYVIVCDDRNNTDDTIANGDLIMDIILDPTRTTKRIGVRFNINPKGSRATEFVA